MSIIVHIAPFFDEPFFVLAYNYCATHNKIHFIFSHSSPLATMHINGIAVDCQFDAIVGEIDLVIVLGSVMWLRWLPINICLVHYQHNGGREKDMSFAAPPYKEFF